MRGNVYDRGEQQRVEAPQPPIRILNRLEGKERALHPRGRISRTDVQNRRAAFRGRGNFCMRKFGGSGSTVH